MRSGQILSEYTLNKAMKPTSAPDSSFPSRPRLPAEDRRSQLIAAALEIFAEQGFHGTPTRELARHAGVSEALVFHHFPTKEALIHAMIDALGFKEQLAMMEQHLVRIPPRDALVRLAEQFLTRLRDEPGIFRVVFSGLVETPHLAGEFYRNFLSRLLELETRLFERAYAERAARTGAAPRSHRDLAVVARSFHGSLLFYNVAAAVARVEKLPSDPAALAAAIVNIYLPEDES
ncbi:MAG: TetR/AcrR family transcriptional regulator [Deltaproteobacteria bacterium]|nr:MAG: TetR/AcrR family transcriptional regulator [Deltaproteobacteria bacterium]